MLFFSPPAKSFSQFDNKSPIFFFYGFPKTFIKRMKLKKFIFPSCGTPWASTVEDENCLGRGGGGSGEGGEGACQASKFQDGGHVMSEIIFSSGSGGGEEGWEHTCQL